MPIRYINPDKFPFIIPIGVLNGMLAGYLIAIARDRPKGKRSSHVAVGALSGMIANAINGVRVQRWARENPTAEADTPSFTWRFVARMTQQAEIGQQRLRSDSEVA